MTNKESNILSFCLIAKNYIKEFQFVSEKSECLKQIEEFFFSLNRYRGHSLYGFSVFNQEIKDSLDKLITLIGKQVIKVRSIGKFFNRLNLGDHFCFISNTDNLFCIMSAYFQLTFSNSKYNEPQIEEWYSRTLGLAISTFKTYIFGVNDNPFSQGIQYQTNRVCRFCGLSMPQVSFSHKAHAIPEALGNKKLFCYEECNDCNYELESVEHNIIAYMDFRRSTMGVKSKHRNKSPEIIGNNFKVRTNSEGSVEIRVFGERVDEEELKKGIIRLEHSEFITNQGLYRSLVKMVIDLLPNDELKHFQRTIKWIRGEYTFERLPDIYQVFETQFVSHPQLYIFFNHKKLRWAPYCTAVFRVLDAAFLFVVPFADVDNGHFEENSELKEHWNAFKKVFPEKWENWNLSDANLSLPFVDIDISKSFLEPIKYETDKFDEVLNLLPNRHDYSPKWPQINMKDINIVHCELIKCYMKEEFNLTKEKLENITINLYPVCHINYPSEEILYKIVIEMCYNTELLVNLNYISLFHVRNLSLHISNSKTRFDVNNELLSFLKQLVIIGVENQFIKKRFSTKYEPLTLLKILNNKFFLNQKHDLLITFDGDEWLHYE